MEKRKLTKTKKERNQRRRFGTLPIAKGAKRLRSTSESQNASGNLWILFYYRLALRLFAKRLKTPRKTKIN
jgi:hypothetical protein